MKHTQRVCVRTSYPQKGRGVWIRLQTNRTAGADTRPSSFRRGKCTTENLEEVKTNPSQNGSDRVQLRKASFHTTIVESQTAKTEEQLQVLVATPPTRETNAERLHAERNIEKWPAMW